VVAVNARIGLVRSFDQISHQYHGYAPSLASADPEFGGVLRVAIGLPLTESVSPNRGPRLDQGCARTRHQERVCQPAQGQRDRWTVAVRWSSAGQRISRAVLPRRWMYTRRTATGVWTRTPVRQNATGVPGG